MILKDSSSWLGSANTTRKFFEKSQSVNLIKQSDTYNGRVRVVVVVNVEIGIKEFGEEYQFQSLILRLYLYIYANPFCLFVKKMSQQFATLKNVFFPPQLPEQKVQESKALKLTDLQKHFAFLATLLFLFGPFSTATLIGLFIFIYGHQEYRLETLLLYLSSHYKENLQTV